MTPEQLARQYQQRYGAIRNRAQAAASLAWARTGGLTDGDADRLAEVVSRIVLSAELATTRLVRAFLQAQLDEDLDIDAELTTGAALRNGVDPLEVYRRPAVNARVAVALGHTFDEAMARAGQRASVLAQTDVALSQRAAISLATDATPRIVGYRRVLTGRSCAFCATASTQRYRRGELMPLHPRCDCSVAPMIGDRDPGHVINRPLLRQLKSAGNASGDPQYWKSRHLAVDADGTVHLPEIVVHEHGELGPYLQGAEHHFTGPDDLAA
ncbi:MAG: hypothetical protein AB7H43_10760 [Acidimicrobiia bacterium]